MAKRKAAKSPAPRAAQRSSNPEKARLVGRSAPKIQANSNKASRSSSPKAKAAAPTPTKSRLATATRIERSAPPFVRNAIGIAGETIELVDPEKPLPKTKLSAKELRQFKALLLAKRRELLGDVSQLSSEALHNNRQDAAGDLSNMPSHMADIGSDNWEQEFTLGLIAQERALLREIDSALERIESRTYGVCLATHRMISTKRLEAKPWARHCIEYARLREAGRAP